MDLIHVETLRVFSVFKTHVYTRRLAINGGTGDTPIGRLVLTLLLRDCICHGVVELLGVELPLSNSSRNLKNGIYARLSCDSNKASIKSFPHDV